MRKKHLIEELNRSQERVRQLEDLICPVESHVWIMVDSVVHYFSDPLFVNVERESKFICKKCRKVKWETR